MGLKSVKYFRFPRFVMFGNNVIGGFDEDELDINFFSGGPPIVELFSSEINVSDIEHSDPIFF
jgi:hypothetical protein